VFGDQAVRSLAERAKKDLDTRVGVLMAAEEQRYLALVDALGVDPASPDQVRNAARRVDDERFARQSRIRPGDHSE